MANQNLSQFGEKLFVADADHTFIWDTENSISKRVSRNSWLNSGTLTSDAPVTISQTWGTTGTYTAFKVVANETATAAATSNLLELWSGSTPTLKAYVKKLGSFVGGVVGVNSPAALAFPLSGAYSVGVYSPESYKIQFAMASGTVAGPVAAAYTGFQYEMTAGVLSWGLTNQDIVLARDSQNTLALRNGAAAQTFNVYGTYTSGTSYERLTLSAPSAANAIIGTNKGSGGGTARGLEFQTDGTSRITIASGGAVTFNFTGSATTFVTNINCLYDINPGAGRYFRYVNSTGISSPSAGVLQIEDLQAVNTTPRIQFAGTTDSFPALKRSTTRIQAVLATTDTTFTNIQGKLTTDTDYTATVVTPTGFLTLYDAQGTAYRVPCVAA